MPPIFVLTNVSRFIYIRVREYRLREVTVETIKEIVQHRYAEAAQRARDGEAATCGCGTSAACCPDPITSKLYDQAQTGAVPREAVLASLG